MQVIKEEQRTKKFCDTKYLSHDHFIRRFISKTDRKNSQTFVVHKIYDLGRKPAGKPACLAWHRTRGSWVFSYSINGDGRYDDHVQLHLVHGWYRRDGYCSRNEPGSVAYKDHRSRLFPVGSD